MGTNRCVEEVVILNYERLGKIFEAKPRKGAKKLSKRDLARRGAASEEFDIVLFDESHALKNLTSLRAKFSVKPKYGDGIEWKLEQDADFLRDA